MPETALKDLVLSANLQPKSVKVFRYLDHRANVYDLTFGACESVWAENPEHRMGLLFERMWTLVHSFNFDPHMIHTALQGVPEYRNSHGEVG